MKTATLVSLIALCTSGPVAAQSPFLGGLQFPQRMVFTPLGNLLVSEGGSSGEPNTGRVSLVTRQGSRRSLLEGLPAAPGHGTPAFGPTGMGLDGRTLYLAIGEGNVMVGPPFSVNLDGPSSPIFSSVLKIQFSADVDAIASGFQLSPNDHWKLIDGYDVDVRNATGDRATVHLLTIFRALVRNVLGGAARARPADPYGVWLDASKNALYIADASSETIVKVDTVTGRYVVVTRFQPDERATPAGVTLVDNVPTALCQVGDSFLVSFLSAGPFPPGSGSVKTWSPASGAWSRPSLLIADLTMVTDMACLRGGTGAVPRVATVEYATTTPASPTTPSGRVQVFDGAQRRVVAQDILLPTGITQDPVSGDLFVLTLSGTLLRLPLP